MLILAPLLAQVFPAARETYGSCHKKTRYDSLVEASQVALKRSTVIAAELYCYPCQHCEGWHLSHLAPTLAQLRTLEAFNERQRRPVVLQMRQHRRTIEALLVRMRAAIRHFDRLNRTAISGVPVPSRIQAHYRTLRDLSTQMYHDRQEALAVGSLYDAQVVIIECCQRFTGPCAAWRAAVEQALDTLTQEIERTLEGITAQHTEEQAALHEAEAAAIDAMKPALRAHFRMSL